ncbi:MAG: ATP-binding protein [Peptostreptococcaceae bacterium]
MINILNAINDYILVINKNGGIEFCNERLLKKLRYENNELKNINTLLLDNDIKSILDTLKSNINDIKLLFTTRDNKKVLINSKLVIDNFNEKEALFIIGNEVEDVSNIESIKNEFFANISHEFKTPLNLILGTIQLLDKNIKEESIVCKNNIDINKHTKCIKQNSYRLLRLANNIIDMTKIESGYYSLQLKNHDIINIIEEITLSISSYTEQLGIDLIFDTDSEETILACDPDKIERIILNLLSNAIKYTDSGGEINVYLKTTSSKIIVSIKDSGSGISKDKLPFIFGRYVQGDKSDRKIEGSGIGLSLVKSLVEMHNGIIYVNSELGTGSEFIFEIPITLVSDDNINSSYAYEQYDKIEKCNIEFSDVYSL